MSASFVERNSGILQEIQFLVSKYFPRLSAEKKLIILGSIFSVLWRLCMFIINLRRALGVDKICYSMVYLAIDIMFFRAVYV